MPGTHKPSVLLFISLWIFLLSCSIPGSKHNDSSARITFVQDSIASTVGFDAVKTQYDTLIPTMNGWFITCDSFNYAAYMKMIPEQRVEDTLSKDRPQILRHRALGFNGFTPESKKWGVIDSTGQIIIPFMCDGIRELENGQGVFSIYAGSYSLNTGIPRYNYSGYSFFFDREGGINKEGNSFTITTIFVGDFHHAAFVIENGHTFYLPAEYYIPNKKARGAVSKVPFGK